MASIIEPLGVSKKSKSKNKNRKRDRHLSNTPPPPSVDDNNGEELPCNGNEVGEMIFEDMFYDPISHTTAWTLLHQKTTAKPVIVTRLRRGEILTSKIAEEEELARSKARNVSSDADVKSKTDKKSKKVKKVGESFPLEKQSNAGDADGSASSEKTDTDTQTSEHDDHCGNNDISQGVAMINELLTRYDNCKKMYKQKSTKCEFSTAEAGSDSSELEEISGDEFDPDLNSDFMKYSVPQYELKSKLCDMHYREIAKLPSHQIGKLCRGVIPELKKIKTENLPSKRHEIFKTCGNMKQNALQDLIVAKPFTATQDSCILNIIKNYIVGDDDDPTENNGEMLHYISLVLLPEALIRIYAQVNCVQYDLAEKELRFGAGYDGTLPEELVHKLEQKEKVKVSSPSPIKSKSIKCSMRKRKQVVYSE